MRKYGFKAPTPIWKKKARPFRLRRPSRDGGLIFPKVQRACTAENYIQLFIQANHLTP